MQRLVIGRQDGLKRPDSCFPHVPDSYCGRFPADVLDEYRTDDEFEVSAVYGWPPVSGAVVLEEPDEEPLQVLRSRWLMLCGWCRAGAGEGVMAGRLSWHLWGEVEEKQR